MNDFTAKPEQKHRLSIQAELRDKFNFAAHQNAYALLDSLSIENGSDKAVEDVRLSIRADPEFLEPKVWSFDRVDPEGVVFARDRDIKIIAKYLQGLTESVRGTVTFRAEANGELLAEKVEEIWLLAFNEWGGGAFMPELVAAFCTPNSWVIDRILKSASGILKENRLPGEMSSGYEKGPRRVWEQASAIYSAIAKLDLGYVEPPASFERNGQKIRMPERIADGRMATCLDTSLLFAAALESAGLDPVIVMPAGHALVGVWMMPSRAENLVVDNALQLRKQVELNRLHLIETTMLAADSVLSFDRAIEKGAEWIAQGKDESFLAAVDIRQARNHKILPLSIRESIDSATRKTPEPSPIPPFVEPPTEMLPPTTVVEPGDHEPHPQTARLKAWQNRLLDLTANNSLLAFRFPVASLELVCPDVVRLVDKLFAGNKLKLKHVSKNHDNEQDEAINRQRTGRKISDEYACAELERKRILVDLDRDELARKAVALNRRAQSSLQEDGANTLFLALGFLRWYRETDKDKVYSAPLVLVPVSMSRPSVLSSFSIQIHDDDVRFNSTLVKMLEKDFGITGISQLENNLPMKGTCIDIEAVWNHVRLKIESADSLEVVEDVALGCFRFAKFLMWKDLAERTRDLKKNRLVRHLIDKPTNAFSDGAEFVGQHEVDKDLEPRDLLTPLPADASQMAAVASADRGKSFVLIGPPGTGKSQTIVNIIAHMLGRNKTVLFVSEKTAALEVVYRRLEQVGLGRFCLRLHSDKSGKRQVMDQLNYAWSQAGTLTADQWEKTAKRLGGLRDQLNEYVNRLHHEHRNGLTPYKAMGKSILHDRLAKRIDLSWPDVSQHSKDDYEKLVKLVNALQVQSSSIGNISDSPLSAIAHDEWKPDWVKNLATAARKLADISGQLKASTDELCNVLGIRLPDYSLSRLEALHKLTSALTDSHRKQASFALASDAGERIEALESAVRYLRKYSSDQAGLSCEYAPDAWRRLDGAEIARRWRSAGHEWWPKSFFLRRSIVRHMRSNGAVGKPNPENDGPILEDLRRSGRAIDGLDKKLDSLNSWSAHDSNPAELTNLRALAQRLRSTTAELSDDSGGINIIREKLRDFLLDDDDLLASEQPAGRASGRYGRLYRGFDEAMDRFKALAGHDGSKTPTALPGMLDDIKEMAEGIVERKMRLKDWCHWQHRKNQAVDAGLGPLVEAVEKGDVFPEQLLDAFKAAYSRWWAGRILDEDEVLRSSMVEHENAIDQFREVCDQFQEITGKYIAAKISGRIADAEENEDEHGAQWGLLKRELQKKSRIRPVRKLVEDIPNVLTALSPCMMMSPMSIAQYLPTNQSLFDVVIFDEASQIAVWDAVGALARARQAIVVGDPKQLPPTSFFMRGDSADEFDYDDADLESILDEMMAARVGEITLNMHYRSRHESLIAFSNQQYYDNGLITFPSAETRDTAVTLIEPEGFYTRGTSKINQGEAKAIVKEVVRRLTHPKPGEKGQSIGIVTFNYSQQKLIEDLLETARAEFREVNNAFLPDSEEPVFVKNLETVQGDERDVILFSVTYGPDQSGHVTGHFGPLNQDGGERRLNVAVTRARSEMMVFSTLKSSHIRLGPATRRGVQGLKHFLEYAERGTKALGRFEHGSVGDYESPLEIAIARALKNNGWEVHPQIGVSNFRIDLGIVHPDFPGLYLAGVECDGAMYHSSATAQERDKIRQKVLEGLGWNILRVWSTNWWTDRAGALEKVNRQLEKLLQHDRERREREKKEKQREKHQQGDAVGGDEMEPGESHCTHPAHGSGKNTTEPEKKTPPSLPGSHEADRSKHRYIKADLAADGKFLAEQDAFYENFYEDRLKAMIDYVVDVEGPIHELVLVRRISRHHGFGKAGRRIHEHVVNLAKTRRSYTQDSTGRFFWKKGMVGDGLAPGRYLDRDDELRNVDYISAEELREIDRACALNADAKKLSSMLGIARLTARTRKRIEDALRLDRDLFGSPLQ